MIITYVNFKLNTLKLFPIYFVLKNNDAIIIFSGDKTYLLCFHHEGMFDK